MNAPEPVKGEDGKAGRGVGFFRSRWRGAVPLDRLFWRDLVLVGTAMNIASSVAALILLGLKLPLALTLAAHFAPVPYNIFGLLPSGELPKNPGGAKASLMMLGAALWLIVLVVV